MKETLFRRSVQDDRGKEKREHGQHSEGDEMHRSFASRYKAGFGKHCSGARSELVTFCICYFTDAKPMLSHFCHPGAQRLNDVSFTYNLSAQRRTSAFVPQKRIKVTEAKCRGPSLRAQEHCASGIFEALRSG